MIGIDKYAYTSKISKIDPKTKLLFALFPLCICIICNSFIISILTIVIMTYATLKLGGISYNRLFKLMLIPTSFLLVGVLTIIINRFLSSENLLLSINLGNYFYGVSGESLIKGLKIVFKALGAVSCMYFFSLNTSMNDFFNFLRKTRLPILFIELMELMYKFIFVIWEEKEKVYIAQSSRLGYLGFKNKLKSSAELMTVLFLRSFRRVDKINISLESRGFDGSLDILTDEYMKHKKMEFYTIIIAIILILVYILERIII